MNANISFNRNLVIFGIPLCIFAGLILFLKYSFPLGHSTLNLAITADLLLTVPLVYFLLIRKTEIPKTTVIPMILIGLLIGTYLLPKESQNYLTLFKTWALPVIEISVMTFVVIKFRRAISSYKELKGIVPDFYSTLKSVCSEVVPKKLVLPLATEFAVIYYGFIDWKTKPLRENEFTYHKNSGTPALLGAVIFIVVIESIVFHLLIARWNIVAAWILTGLSVYTAIQLLGFAKSLFKRPIHFDDDNLFLKYGILNEVEIPLADIDTIELSSKTLDEDFIGKTLSPLGELESHNMILHLSEEHELVGLYGMKNKFKVIALHIDEPKDFKEKLESSLL